jgi:hypothetical protein
MFSMTSSSSFSNFSVLSGYDDIATEAKTRRFYKEFALGVVARRGGHGVWPPREIVCSDPSMVRH